jgi:hypothetical protein
MPPRGPPRITVISVGNGHDHPAVIDFLEAWQGCSVRTLRVVDGGPRRARGNEVGHLQRHSRKGD